MLDLSAGAVFLKGTFKRPSDLEAFANAEFVGGCGVFECLRNCVKVDLCTGAVCSSRVTVDLSAGAVFSSAFSRPSEPKGPRKPSQMLDLSAGAVFLKLEQSQPSHESRESSQDPMANIE